MLCPRTREEPLRIVDRSDEFSTERHSEIDLTSGGRSECDDHRRSLFVKHPRSDKIRFFFFLDRRFSFHLGIELTDQLTVKNARDLKKCTSAIQEFVIERLNDIITMKLRDSINVLHDNYVGTLTRCLYSLESNGEQDESELSASKALQEVKKNFHRLRSIANFVSDSSRGLSSERFSAR